VLLATVLALTAAVLHAGWNISIKQTSDRFLALWAQFFFAGCLALSSLVIWSIVDGAPDIAWRWAIFSGLGHLPYVVLLARSYDRSDLSVTYPIARGGGALGAAVLGVIVLKDNLSTLSIGGIAILMCGMWMLTLGQSKRHVMPALGVAVTIGVYSVIDAYGARQSNPLAFSFSVFISGATTISIWAVATRARELCKFVAASWKTSAIGGLMSMCAYSLVLIAVTHAPLGYVASLRESSVVIAAFAGWRMLGEGDHKRRLIAAAIVVFGLVVLVLGR